MAIHWATARFFGRRPRILYVRIPFCQQTNLNDTVQFAGLSREFDSGGAGSGREHDRAEHGHRPGSRKVAEVAAGDASVTGRHGQIPADRRLRRALHRHHVPDDAVNSLRIVLAADKAFRTGRTIDLPA